MTDEQIIEAVATKVMGWHVSNSPVQDFYWQDAQNKPTADDGWNPLTNPVHTQQVRDKLAAAARHGSKSDSRKAASAMIAKIPLALSRFVARAFLP